MFFYLSKTIGFFAAPSNVFFSLVLLGLVLQHSRFKAAGYRLLIVGFCSMLVFGILPFGQALTFALEQRFPPWSNTSGTPDGIVILGGVIDPETSAKRGTIALNEAAERVTEIASLARRYPAARIVFSGGSANVLFDGRDEATFATPLLESFGISRDRVSIETQSRNTAENAQFSKELVRPTSGQRWLLVTSAAHMPRAVGAFRKAGFPVEAYPVDWRTRDLADLLPESLSPLEGLRKTDVAVREWIGILVYWATGRTSELFPGPATKGN